MSNEPSAVHFVAIGAHFHLNQKLTSIEFLYFHVCLCLGAFYMELNTTIVYSAIKSHEQLSQVTVVASSAPAPQIVQVASSNRKSARRISISKNFLLSSSHIAHICNGEFGALIVAWNLIMEYIVIVALISKALIIYLDAAIYDNVGHLTQLIPMSWPLSEYFDVLALLVPIVIGGKPLLNSF